MLRVVSGGREGGRRTYPKGRGYARLGFCGLEPRQSVGRVARCLRPAQVLLYRVQCIALLDNAVLPFGTTTVFVNLGLYPAEGYQHGFPCLG